MRRSAALVGGLALALWSSTLAAPPRPGGRVTIVLDGSEEGDAIAAELVERMTSPFLVHPDGVRSTLNATAIGTSDRAWAVELPEALTFSHPGLAHVLAGSLGRAAGRGVWADLNTCDPDTSRRPHRVVLRFADPTCQPLARFGAWPAPPPLVPGFRANPERVGSYARNPDADLWQPRLDEIIIVRSSALDPPGSGEITIGAVASSPIGGRDDHPPVGVAYRLTPVGGSWPDSLRAWMAQVLPRGAFEPLVPPSMRAAPDLGAGIDSVSGVRTSPLGVDVVYLVGSEGATSDRLRGRARALLARRGVTLRDGLPADDATPVLRLDSVVRLGYDPVTDLRLYGASDARGEHRSWFVLEIRVPVQRGEDVVGDIASPDLLWHARQGEETR